MKGNEVSLIDFVFVDDDPISNMICEFTIEMMLGKVGSQSFVNPELALEYFANMSLPGGNHNKTVLLLDINMPGMSGWEFLERFDHLNGAIKDLVHVYILSSSVDERDTLRSYANKNVVNFLIKPLSKETVFQVINGWLPPNSL
jgi:CheY-like chemotaxis protein